MAQAFQNLNMIETSEVILDCIALVLALSREFSLLGNLWIISQSPASPRAYNVKPIITSVCYALSEPVWKVLLVYMPLPFLRTVVIFSGLHVIATMISSYLLTEWLEADVIAGKLRSRAPDESPESDRNPHNTTETPTSAAYALFLVPTQTAAVQNAALLP